jgi:BMFP domain-containing protein YqiC
VERSLHSIGAELGLHAPSERKRHAETVICIVNLYCFLGLQQRNSSSDQHAVAAAQRADRINEVANPAAESLRQQCFPARSGASGLPILHSVVWTYPDPSCRSAPMINQSTLDDLSRRVRELVASSPAQDVQRNVRAVVGSALQRMDLVTREEFDVQAAVLARTREKLEVLEARVAGLERGAAGGPPVPVDSAG